jgi:hypothetical protein
VHTCRQNARVTEIVYTYIFMSFDKGRTREKALR